MQFNVFGSVVIGCCALGSVSVGASAQLFGLGSGNGTLYQVSPGTGQASRIGTLQNVYGTLFVGLDGLRGSVYASDVELTSDDYRFGRIDLDTGVFTSLNNQNGSFNWQGLAGDDLHNVLYTVDREGINKSLLSVSPTGAISTIGSTHLSVCGMAYNGATQTLFAVSADNNNLYRINTSTAVPTIIGALGLTTAKAQRGLTYDPVTDQLFLSDGDDLYSVNMTTGAASTVGPFGIPFTVLGTEQSIDGLAFIPEPTSLAAMSIPLAILQRRRRS